MHIDCPIVRLNKEPAPEITRYMIGFINTRKAVHPVYSGSVVCGHEETQENVSEFKLIGWGSTIDLAASMANLNGFTFDL